MSPDEVEAELERQLAVLAARSTDLAEGQEQPRGAVPALFRAARAAGPQGEARLAAALAARLPDRALLEPALALAGAGAPAVGEAWRRGLAAAAADRDAWCCHRQVAVLDALAPDPATIVALLRGMTEQVPRRGAVGGEGAGEWDPTELGLRLEPARLQAALREVVRLRLAALTRRRDRVSAELARGALRGLAALGAADPALHALCAQVASVETRRAGKDDPLLALAALEVLALAPPLARLRLLPPLLRALERPKVVTCIEDDLATAAREAQASKEDLADLGARAGGLEPDGWVRVPLGEGGEARLRPAARGGLERRVDEGALVERQDERALEAAARELGAARGELVRRLEAAMLSGRGWSSRLWRATVLEGHPLWADLAPRVVWELRRAGAPPARFALGPAGPEDAVGERVALPEGDAPGVSIGVCHPALLDATELELWRERAVELAARDAAADADARRLIAPFAQAFRRVSTRPQVELEAALAALVGREAHKGALGDMARRSGWTGFPLPGTPPWTLERVVAGRGARARLVVEDVVVEAKRIAPARRPALTGDRPLDLDDEDDPGGKKKRRAGPPEAAPRVRITSVEVVADARAAAPASSEADGRRVALVETLLDLEDLTDPLATPDELWLKGWQARRWKDDKEAWREAVLRYRAGSAATVEVRKALLASLARADGLPAGALRLEDRFAITRQRVLELGTGLVHAGPKKDHLPAWRLAEEVGDAPAPRSLPFEPDADPATVQVVARALHLARLDA